MIEDLKGESAKKVLSKVAERNKASIAEVNGLRGSLNEFKRGFYEGQWGAYYNVAWWIEDEADHEVKTQEQEKAWHPDQLLMIKGCYGKGGDKYACLALDGAFLRLYSLLDPEPLPFGAPIENATCTLYPMGDVCAALKDYEELRKRLTGPDFPEGETLYFPEMQAHKTAQGHLVFERHGIGKELASMAQAYVTMPDWRSMPWTK